MLRKKLGLITTAAALALTVIGGVGVSPASAAFVLKNEECSGGTSIAFCWNENGALLELSGEEPITGKAGELLLNVPGVIEIVCKKTEAKGTIVQNEPLIKGSTYHITKLELKLKECDVEGGLATKCEIAENLATNLIKVTPLNVLTVVLEPEGVEAFIVFNVKKKGAEACAAEGLKSLTGKQEASYLAPETFAKFEELKFVEKSELLYAGVAAELTKAGLEFKMENLTDEWDISPTS
jgi:hypothetical protein